MRSLVAALIYCALTGVALAEEGFASVDDGRATAFDGANYRGKVATGARFKASILAVAHLSRLTDAQLDAALRLMNNRQKERWRAADKPQVYVDDPELLAVLAAVGADAAVILRRLKIGYYVQSDLRIARMLYATRHYITQRTYLDKTDPYDPAIHADFPGTLLIQPGKYRGWSFDYTTKTMFQCALDCTQPGLYQIFFPINEGPSGSMGGIHNRIVATTPLALASAVATLHVYGTTDSAMTTAQKLARMLSSPVRLQCGETADVLRALALEAGFEARFAHMITNEPPNGYMNGHSGVEIKVNGKWCFFDPSMSVVPMSKDPDEKIFSIVEACEGVWAGNTEFYELAPFQFDAQPTVYGQWNPWGWCLAEALYDPVERRTALRRLYRVPCITDAGAIWYFLPPGAEQARAIADPLNYRLLSRAEFMTRFYPS